MSRRSHAISHADPNASRSLDAAAILAFLCYSASTVATPLCLVHVSQDLGLSLTQGGTLEAMRSGLILAVLLASAFAAAHWGKACALGIGLLGLAGGALLYSAAPSYGAVLTAIALIGAGSGLIEALINPLVQEQHPDDSGRHLNFVNAFWSVGIVATVLLGGEWLTQTGRWRPVAGAIGILSLLAGTWFLALAGRLGHVRQHSTDDVWRHKGEILRHPRFPVFVAMMLLAGAVEGGLTFWTASFIQLNHGGAARAAGIGTACFAGGMMAGRLAGSRWVPQQGLHRWILASALAGAVVSLALPFVRSLAILNVALFAAGLTVACFWPSIQAYAVDRMGCEPTALFILLSCAGIPGFAGAAWLMGWVGDRAGLDASLALLPAGFLLLVLTTYLERQAPAGEVRA